MTFFKSHYTIIAVGLFLGFIILAHLVSTSQYSFTKNTVSDLGAQGYSQKAIMQWGFLLFGLILSTGVLVNGIGWKNASLFIYAICIAMTGIFCAKPFQINEMINYSEIHSKLHSVFAQIAGIMFSVGILVQLFFEKEPNVKWVHLLFFILIIGCSLGFGMVKNYQGLIQKIMYLISFLWLVKYYHT